jgi:hypothetical protein
MSQTCTGKGLTACSQHHVAALTTINFAKLIFVGTATDAFTCFAVEVWHTPSCYPWKVRADRHRPAFRCIFANLLQCCCRRVKNPAPNRSTDPAVLRTRYPRRYRCVQTGVVDRSGTSHHRTCIRWLTAARDEFLRRPAVDRGRNGTQVSGAGGHGVDPPPPPQRQVSAANPVTSGVRAGAWHAVSNGPKLYL